MKFGIEFMDLTVISPPHLPHQECVLIYHHLHSLSFILTVGCYREVTQAELLEQEKKKINQLFYLHLRTEMTKKISRKFDTVTLCSFYKHSE